MARELTSIGELKDSAMTAAKARIVMMDYVAPVVEEILRKHIESDIYGAYTPKFYERSYSLTANVRSQMISDDELLVTSTAVPNTPHAGWHSSGDGAFLYMLEVGDLGWWRKDFPRAAISNTQRETDSSTKVRQAMKLGVEQVTK